MTVVAVAADQRVGALAADDGVVAGAAVDGELDDAGRRASDATIVSLPPRPLTTRLSFAPSAPVTFTWADRPTTDTEVPAPKTLMISSPWVALTFTVSICASPVGAADGRAEVDIHGLHIGAAQVADVHDVRAAERVDGRRLDVVHVHHDVADIAGEAQALAVRRHLEGLGDVRAVEQHRVGAVLALDGVVAVARIPLEHVVSRAKERGVAALVAVDEVVAVAADQPVVAVAAEDGVVAGAAVDGEVDQRSEVAGRREHIVAAVHVEHEVLGGADVEEERRRADAIEPHARTVRGER